MSPLLPRLIITGHGKKKEGGKKVIRGCDLLVSFGAPMAAIKFKLYDSNFNTA